MVRIESSILRVEIDELGAQIRSLYHKENQLEYLWQRDLDYWSSSAPVVFPVIGKLTNGVYRYRQKEYELKSNGLIRYKTVKLIDKGENFAEFSYRPDEEDMQRFPFPFTFEIRFEVVDNRLTVSAKITNTGDGPLHYLYAGHPGFNVPLYENESCDDYYVEFDQKENISIYDVCETGQLLNKKVPFFANENRFFIRKNLFRKEALAFIHPKSDSLMIKNIKNEHSVKVQFDGFDNVAIWSPYHKDKDLKFICVEPWIGHTEFRGFKGDWDEHDEMKVLDSQKSNTHIYSIELK